MAVFSFSREVESILRSHQAITDDVVQRIIKSIPAGENPLCYILRESSSLSGFEPASIATRFEIIKILLDKNPELINTEDNGDTPLELARALGDTRIINLLGQKANTPTIIR